MNAWKRNEMKRIIILTGTNAVAAGSRVMLSWLQRLEAEGFEAAVCACGRKALSRVFSRLGLEGGGKASP
jgi:hypothetical protein